MGCAGLEEKNIEGKSSCAEDKQSPGRLLMGRRKLCALVIHAVAENTRKGVSSPHGEFCRCHCSALLLPCSSVLLPGAAFALCLPRETGPFPRDMKDLTGLLQGGC